MDIELWFSKDVLNFLKWLNSKNSVVRMVTKNGKNWMHSVTGRNLGLMESRFGMEEYDVCKVWEQESNDDRLCVQIRELCKW